MGLPKEEGRRFITLLGSSPSSHRIALSLTSKPCPVRVQIPLWKIMNEDGAAGTCIRYCSQLDNGQGTRDKEYYKVGLATNIPC